LRGSPNRGLIADMRTSSFTLGLAFVVFAACGGRTGSEDAIGVSGIEGNTGGSSPAIATGGSPAIATGGKGAKVATGGSGNAFATGGSLAIATGGSKSATGGTKSATGGSLAIATGGKSVAIATGGSGAAFATGGTKSAAGGSLAIATGGKGGNGASGGVGGGGAAVATGGYPLKATGGSSATSPAGGSGAAIATGGFPTKVTGGSPAIATGGSSASGGMAGTGGSTTITTCNDNFPYLGTWQGNILDYYFEPTQAIELDLYKDASGNIVGKFTWGSGTPPPAPQSADIPWPPGYWEQQDPRMPFMETPDPWPGFAYTIVRGAGCDTTFRFAVSTAELWQNWCVLMAPVYTPNYGWGCTLKGGGSSDGKTCTVQPSSGAWATYPMWKCEACGAFGMNGVCACDQNGCFADITATHTFNLAYSVSGGTDTLSGPDPNCSDCTVRLQRKN
jgi:hypothetical protein